MTNTLAVGPRHSNAIARNVARPLVYTPALDGIRCIAISLVIASHVVAPAHFGGDVGVDVFFVLSGYLITTILMSDLSSSRLSLKTFYARRMIRLAPALITTVVVTVPVALTLSPLRHDIIEGGIFALLYLTPITKTLVPTPGSWFGHTWTLGLEEYFYLGWPLALAFLHRRRTPWRVAAWLVGGAGALLLVAKELADPSHTEPVGQLRVGGIAIGCALAILLRHKPQVPRPTLLCALGFVIIISSAFIEQDGPFSTAGYVIADLGGAALIAGLVGGGGSVVRRFLELWPIVYLGQISYELYLVHYPVLIGASDVTGALYRATAWWTIPLAVAIAAALHEGFKPMQRSLRRRLSNRSRAMAHTLSAAG